MLKKPTLHHDELVLWTEIALEIAAQNMRLQQAFNFIGENYDYTFSDLAAYLSVREARICFTAEQATHYVYYIFDKNPERSPSLMLCVWNGPAVSGEGTHTVQLFNRDRDVETN